MGATRFSWKINDEAMSYMLMSLMSDGQLGGRSTIGGVMKSQYAMVVYKTQVAADRFGGYVPSSKHLADELGLTVDELVAETHTSLIVQLRDEIKRQNGGDSSAVACMMGGLVKSIVEFR